MTDESPDAHDVVLAIEETAAGSPSPAGIWLGVGVYLWSETVVSKVLMLVGSRHANSLIVVRGPQIPHQSQGAEQSYPTLDFFTRGYASDALAELVTWHSCRAPVMTEGQHPESAEALELVASELAPRMNGWQPTQGEGRAISEKERRPCHNFGCGQWSRLKAGIWLRHQPKSSYVY